MKKLVYNVALALCAMVTINSCSLDEYNPMEVTGEETLATFDGWYGMQTQCYNPIYSQLYTVTDFLSVAEALQIISVRDRLRHHQPMLLLLL